MLMFAGERVSLVGPTRLARLRWCATECSRRRVRGAFVECGVWRGGSAGEVLSRWRGSSFLFDSFCGMPKATDDDVDFCGRRADAIQNLGLPLPGDHSDISICRAYLASRGADFSKVEIVQGWFADTFPLWLDRIPKIALLHIDCDFYEPVKLVLETWYPRVAVGGIVAIDDYGHWRGCRKAVDEYLPQVKLNVTDRTGVWFRKASDANTLV